MGLHVQRVCGPRTGLMVAILLGLGAASPACTGGTKQDEDGDHRQGSSGGAPGAGGGGDGGDGGSAIGSGGVPGGAGGSPSTAGAGGDGGAGGPVGGIGGGGEGGTGNSAGGAMGGSAGSTGSAGGGAGGTGGAGPIDWSMCPRGTFPGVSTQDYCARFQSLCTWGGRRYANMDECLTEYGAASADNQACRAGELCEAGFFKPGSTHEREHCGASAGNGLCAPP